jgi:hypothetical protein
MRPYNLFFFFPSAKPSGPLFEPSSGPLLAPARPCLSLSILSGSSSGFFPLFCLAATRPLQALYIALSRPHTVETRVIYPSGSFERSKGFLGFFIIFSSYSDIYIIIYYRMIYYLTIYYHLIYFILIKMGFCLAYIEVDPPPAKKFRPLFSPQPFWLFSL